MAAKVMHIGKCKLSQVGGLRNHMENRDRVKTNDNIDLERSKYNYCIDGLSAKDLETRVRQRIADAGVKRKIRPDAVGLEDIIIGANHEWMQNASKETRDAYFHDAVEFFAERFGRENVMYAEAHMDESNIHLHLGLVPIVTDEKGNACLSAKKFIKKSDFGKLHDDFAKEVSSKYGLERGGGKKDEKGNPKKYPDMNAYKAEKEEKIKEGIRAAEELRKLNRKGSYDKSFGIFEDRDFVRMPTDVYKKIYEAAKLNAEAASMAADELVKRETAETRSKVLKEEQTRLEGELERVRGNLKDVQEETRTYRDAPDYIKANFEQARQDEIIYQQNIQRECVTAFLRNRRDFTATLRDVAPMLKDIGVVGRNEQSKYVKKCLAECLKQARAAYVTDKKTGRFRHDDKGRNIPKKDFVRPSGSGSMSGSSSSSWQSPPSKCSFLSSLIGGEGLPVGGPGPNFDYIEWDLLSPEEKARIIEERNEY